MAIVSAIKVKNLRSLKDTGFIEIKPITILVGKNSAGKSTFARTFPLLRQSVEENKRAPILWYGRLVDFGAFPDALSRNTGAEEIEFGFRLLEAKNFDLADKSTLDRLPFSREVPLLDDAEMELSIRICKETTSHGTYASNVTLKLFGNVCSVDFTNSETVARISVNNYVWEDNGDQRNYFVRQKQLIPKLEFVGQRRVRISGSDEYLWIENVNPILSQLKSELSRHLHGNTSAEKIERMIEFIGLGDDENMLKSMRAIPDAPSTWCNYLDTIDSNSKWFGKVKNLVFAVRLPALLETIDAELASYFSGVRYLEPLRASAQRYYRRQELAIDEIDSKGANVAMYLDSLTVREKEMFEEWTQAHFGVTVSTANEGGHIALKLREGESANATNLADMGFGFSQVLPIAVQLWSSVRPGKNRLRKMRRRGMTTCLVIEQPELHLHPEYQSRLADIMVAAMSESENNKYSRFSVIAETHSPNIINRLGQLIERGKLKVGDVQVILFDKEKADSDTQIRIANFDGNGVLLNWPYGFFEPEGR